MVLDKARPKNKDNSIWPGMRERDAARNLTLKVNILQVCTIDLSKIQFIVNHNSQSDGQNKSAKSGMKLHKKTIHIVTLQWKRKDDKGQCVYYLEQVRQKWAYETSIWFSSCCLSQKPSPPRVRRKSWRAHFSKTIQEMTSFFKHFVVGHVWMELDWAHKNFLSDLFFYYSRFRLQSIAIRGNRREVLTGTPHTFFFSHTLSLCTHTTSWLKEFSVRISFHPVAIQDVTCLSVRLLSFRQPSHRLWAQGPRQLRPLRDFCNDHSNT